MITITESDLVESVADALQYISYFHPMDYIRALGVAYEAEQGPAAKDAIAQILTNSRMCAEGHRPICQDTGIVTVFVKWGQDCRLDSPRSLQEVVDEGVRRAYLYPENKLRASIVADPAFTRVNTKDNTPSVVNVEMVPGSTVDVTVAAKGGGSENKSKFAMLNPSRLDRGVGARTNPEDGRGLVPARHARHRHRWHRRKGDDARQGIADGRHRHGATKTARPRQRHRTPAHRDFRQGQRARHRCTRAWRAGDDPRRENRKLADARRLQTCRDDPELRRHPPRTFHAGWLRPRLPRTAQTQRLARCELDARQGGDPR